MTTNNTHRCFSRNGQILVCHHIPVRHLSAQNRTARNTVRDFFRKRGSYLPVPTSAMMFLARLFRQSKNGLDVTACNFYSRRKTENYLASCLPDGSLKLNNSRAVARFAGHWMWIHRTCYRGNASMAPLKQNAVKTVKVE